MLDARKLVDEVAAGRSARDVVRESLRVFDPLTKGRPVRLLQRGEVVRIGTHYWPSSKNPDPISGAYAGHYAKVVGHGFAGHPTGKGFALGGSAYKGQTIAPDSEVPLKRFQTVHVEFLTGPAKGARATFHSHELHRGDDDSWIGARASGHGATTGHGVQRYHKDLDRLTIAAHSRAAMPTTNRSRSYPGGEPEKRDVEQYPFGEARMDFSKYKGQRTTKAPGHAELDPFVACKYCGRRDVPAAEAHLHQGLYVCDGCWDDRLGSTA